MTRVRRRRRGRRDEGLTEAQFWYLLIGPKGKRDDAFTSLLEARAAWYQHKAAIFEDWDKPGDRPYGWWKFESKVPQPDDNEGRVIALRQMGVLEPWEAARLQAWEAIRKGGAEEWT